MKTATKVALTSALMISMPALHGQSVSGTVVAASTGVPIADAGVLAVPKVVATVASKAPQIYKARVDAAGHFEIPVPAGQYELCVHGPKIYLDPCQWGGSSSISVTGTSNAVLSLPLQTGGQFVVRVHDAQGVLQKAEAVLGSGVFASITGASINGRLPLPFIQNAAGIRDYGMTVPVNVMFNATVTSAVASFVDATGAALTVQNTPFQVVPPTAFAGTPGTVAGLFAKPSNAYVLHVYATSPVAVPH